MKDKKGQIRMVETIAVLFIFFLLLGIGILFYFQYQKGQMAVKETELLGARAVDTTLRALFLPELICSKGETEPEGNCVDLMKLRYANGTMMKHLNDYYYNLFGYAKITIIEVYPLTKEWTLYDKEKPDWTAKEPTFQMINLRDELQGISPTNYGYGYIVVEVYS